MRLATLVRSLVTFGRTPEGTPQDRQALLPEPQRRASGYRGIVAALLSSSFVSQCWFTKPALAQPQAYCQFPKELSAEKDNLLKGSLKGNADAQKRYKTLLKRHGDELRRCRSQTWPNTQAIWLRLYPCDVRAGVLDELFDRIVNRGYNQVNLQVFGDSQVLLPVSDNPNPKMWPSVVRTPGSEKVDLLAQAIQKGHERGIKVYAWMYTMNFGYVYGLQDDRKSSLARNGKGQTGALDILHDGPQAFIDPYSQQAKTDYYQLVQKVVKRRPDGVLFDYIRYPKGYGSNSVVQKVQDLWIYGNAARQALYARALNNKGRALIEKFVSRGNITTADIQAVDRQYPQEGSPMWQGRKAQPSEMRATLRSRQVALQRDLLQLSLAHAVQGILDFFNLARLPAEKQQVKVGAVFFPEGNRDVGGLVRFDSRLQPWDLFPSNIELHPMAFSTCGNSSCIEQEVRRVINRFPASTKVTPVLAGVWGQTRNKHPSLETQMAGIRRSAPQLNSVSHFAFSWQNPEFENQRYSCPRERV